MPQFTSCSPGWVKFCEYYYPDLLPHVSSCKSPQQMFGALAKTYYAKKKNLDPERIFSVSIMPCTAKKFEAARPEMNASGYRDVDVVLTSRELVRMIREAGLDFANLPDEDYDEPMGIGTGAGQIFGATGGVMEAALRTAYELATGKTLEKIDFEEVRGMNGVKAATVPMNGINVKVLVAHGLGNAGRSWKRLRPAISRTITSSRSCVARGAVSVAAGSRFRPAPRSAKCASAAVTRATGCSSTASRTKIRRSRLSTRNFSVSRGATNPMSYCTPRTRPVASVPRFRV